MADSEEETTQKTTNKADDYTPYWKSSGESTGYTGSSDHPEFHVYISFQKSGTEREAEHYEDQGKASDTSDSSDSSE